MSKKKLRKNYVKILIWTNNESNFLILWHKITQDGLAYTLNQPVLFIIIIYQWLPGSLWLSPSLAFNPYQLLPFEGPLDWIQCPCWPYECKSFLVSQRRCVQVKEFTGKCLLLVHSFFFCMSCSSSMISNMEGISPYNCCFEGCYFQDFCQTTRSILT